MCKTIQLTGISMFIIIIIITVEDASSTLVKHTRLGFNSTWVHFTLGISMIRFERSVVIVLIIVFCKITPDSTDLFFRDQGARLLYLKPVQTGYPTDSDADMVAYVAGLEASVGAHALHHLSNKSDQVSPTLYSEAHRRAHTEYAWGLAASPHLAVHQEGKCASGFAYRRFWRTYAGDASLKGFDLGWFNLLQLVQYSVPSY